MTLHQRVAHRLGLTAGLVRFAAFADVFPNLPIEVIEQVFPVDSRAEADQIAVAHGARPKWRNGYYMAEGTVSGRSMEIHFAPLIMEAETTQANPDGES